MDEYRGTRKAEQEAQALRSALWRFIDKEVDGFGEDLRQGLLGVGAGVAWAGFWVGVGLVVLALVS